jgi:hypothetical protein
MRDAEIAKIIHPFTSGQPADRQPELRRDPRWPYPVPQLVAFHDADQLPTKEMLQAVQCHDISLGGISFFLSDSPPFMHCTVVLGRAPNLIFVKARVVHAEVRGEGLRKWKIGCQFLGKAESMLEQNT